MTRLEMGIGFKVLTYFIALMVVVGGSLYVGMELQRAKQVEANVEILSRDSEAALDITIETEKEQEKLDESFKTVKPNDEYLTADELQFLSGTLSTQIKRTNTPRYFRAITD